MPRNGHPPTGHSPKGWASYHLNIKETCSLWEKSEVESIEILKNFNFLKTLTIFNIV